MTREQILTICDGLIDQLTVLKGYIQLDKMNKKIDHSIALLREMGILESMINELVNELLTHKD